MQKNSTSTRAKYECVDCGSKIHYGSTRCRKCAAIFRRDHPNNPTPPRTVCKKCGGKIHLKTPNQKRVYCSRKCSDSARKVPPAKVDHRICEECGVGFQEPGWKSRRNVRYCSVLCARRGKARTVVGKNHPLYKPKKAMRCRVCGTTRMVKPSLVSRFRVCSAKCRGVWSANRMPKVSSLEITMAELFTRECLDFTPQHFIGQYIVDFAFEKERIAVECDGSYWHSLPGKPAKDRQKDGYVRMSGWRMVRLSEDDIKADPEECLRRVIATIHGDDSYVQPLLSRSVDRRTPPKRHDAYVQQSLEVIDDSL